MSSTIEDWEEVIETVANWGVEAIQDVVKALSPNGRPFMFEEQTEEEQLREYFSIQGNPEAWSIWIGDHAGEIISKLQESGLSPDQIASVHPVDIATKYAIQYSAEMEDILMKRAKAVN